MEAAIQTVVKVFVKSSKGKESLGQKDFHNLVKTQLGNILSEADSKEAVKNMSQGLDANNDGKVGFEEYMKLVGYLACSLSEQKNLATEEPEQNAASGQVSQSAPNNTEEQPKENAEAKEETKPEAKEEPKEVAKADAKVEVKAEAKAEGETKPEAAKAVATVAAVTAEVAAAAEVKEPQKVEETVKVEEAAEKSPAAAEDAGKKTEEATS